MIRAVLATSAAGSFVTVARPVLNVDLQGIPGDRHYGFTRLAGAREPWFARGTPIRSGRQLSLVCAEELAMIAAAMDLPVIEPGWIGANIVVCGLAGFSRLAPGARLFCGTGAVLVNEGYNAPCRHAGAQVGHAYPARDGLDALFVKAAAGRGGLVATVERAGPIAPGALAVRLPKFINVQGDLPS